MPNTSQTDTILLSVDIYQKPDRVEFCVMRTPMTLWKILPQKPQFIEGDYTQNVHYFKRFTVRYQGKVYELTFYRTLRKNEKDTHLFLPAHSGGPGL